MSTTYLYKQKSLLGHLTLIRIQYVNKMKKRKKYLSTISRIARNYNFLDINYFNDSWCVLVPSNWHISFFLLNISATFIQLSSLSFSFIFLVYCPSDIYANSSQNNEKQRLWILYSHFQWINFSSYVWYVPNFVVYLWELHTEFIFQYLF